MYLYVWTHLIFWYCQIYFQTHVFPVYITFLKRVTSAPNYPRVSFYDDATVWSLKVQLPNYLSIKNYDINICMDVLILSDYTIQNNTF